MATQTGYKTSELGEIPQDWEVVELGDVAEIKSGGTPSTHQSEFWNGYILWCTPTDITSLSGKYLSDTNRKISELGLINSAAELLPIGSVLMTSRATIGECAIANQPMTTNQGFKNFICNKRINNEFLYYLLGSQKDKFIELCNGSTFLEINTTQVRKFKIAIPKSTTEQTAIATTLSDTDALISSLQTLIAKKQAVKLAAMQNLLGGKIRLPAFAQRPDGSPKTTRQTELGEVPEDWDVVELGEVGEPIIGLTYSPNDIDDNGVLVLRSSNIQSNKLVFDDNVFVKMAMPERVIVKENDILICVRNGSRQLIGKCALITKEAEGFAFGAFMSVFRTPFAPFIFYAFQSDKIQNQIKEIMGATINQITNKDLREFKIAIPKSTAEQTAIAQLLSDMDAEIEALEGRLKKTQSLKQGMMQALLSGKIRLPLK
jgi:restriction modification system DNA specificity domain protein